MMKDFLKKNYLKFILLMTMIFGISAPAMTFASDSMFSQAEDLRGSYHLNGELTANQPVKYYKFSKIMEDGYFGICITSDEVKSVNFEIYDKCGNLVESRKDTKEIEFDPADATSETGISYAFDDVYYVKVEAEDSYGKYQIEYGQTYSCCPPEDKGDSKPTTDPTTPATTTDENRADGGTTPAQTEVITYDNKTEECTETLKLNKAVRFPKSNTDVKKRYKLNVKSSKKYTFKTTAKENTSIKVYTKDQKKCVLKTGKKNKQSQKYLKKGTYYVEISVKKHSKPITVKVK